MAESASRATRVASARDIPGADAATSRPNTASPSRNVRACAPSSDAVPAISSASRRASR